MKKVEKKPKKELRLNNQQQGCLVNAHIDPHALAVRTSQQFYLSKKFKKHAYALATEIAILDPKPIANLKVV